MPFFLNISRAEWDSLFAQVIGLRRDMYSLRRAVDALTLTDQENAMATQAELDDLNAQVTANTNATQAAAAALAGFVKTVADLTAQLEAAVASNDSPAIQAATAALKANNDALAAAVPATATAVTANTPAA